MATELSSVTSVVSDDGGGPSDEAAGDTTYLLVQNFLYDYTSPVRDLRHRLVVVPRAVHGGQRRLDHGLNVSGSPSVVSARCDEFGNHVIDVRAATVAETIVFDAWARVRCAGPVGITTVAPADVGDRRLMTPTCLTRPDSVLADAAADLARAGPSRGGSHPMGIDLAERACSWAHGALTYAYGVTGVRTSAAEAVAGGRGVCQDFAHVMLALCRAAGLPARYVSGHLVGEGGSHAWVEVVVADSAPSRGVVAVAFDPTHDRRAAKGYLTVAVGRDYLDVAPTSGTFAGPSSGTLTARKRLVATDGADAC